MTPLTKACTDKNKNCLLNILQRSLSCTGLMVSVMEVRSTTTVLTLMPLLNFGVLLVERGVPVFDHTEEDHEFKTP
jgi:hypothetical protein